MRSAVAWIRAFAVVATLGLTRDVPQAHAEPEAAVKAAAALAAAEAGFDPSVARLPDDSTERRMLAALEAAQPAEAQRLGQAALPGADPDSRARILWLLYRAAAADPVAARAPLEALSALPHPLARWAALELADALRGTDPARAETLLAPLRSGWAGATRARHLHALSRLGQGDAAAAELALRGLLSELPASAPGTTAALPLAEILARKPEPAALEEALALYRRVAMRTPDSSAGQKARELAAAVLARLPRAHRTALAEPSPEEALIEARALLDARSYARAEKSLTALIARARHDATLRCRVELEHGRTLLQQRKRTEGAALMARLAKDCAELEVKAWARYHAGRTEAQLGHGPEALVHYRALQVEAAGHSLADDAAFKEAVVLADQGDATGARAVRQALLARYPDGDMVAVTRFELAWQAWTEGDAKGALALFDALLAEGAHEDREGLAGRTHYWRARALSALGRKSEAIEAYAALVASLPLSYHAQLALSRLAELAPKRATQVLAELRDPSPLAPLRFPERSELRDPRFASALALLQVDELDRARQELANLGATGPGADQELLWLSAALLHGAHAYEAASRIARDRLDYFMALAPRGSVRHLWRIAFPQAYAPLIENAAAEAGVPASFVRAVAREESGFDPRAVSGANAYGLIQLIQPTAKGHAKALGLPSDPASLKRPEINLRIGSAFISYLWKRYPTNPAVVPAAYNAGHGAADRWLRERDKLDLDEWIESIPYDETRRYTRRVLQSYGIYAWLETGQLPKLDSRLPR
jgi:soluble lytic murein transglycosylase